MSRKKSKFNLGDKLTLMEDNYQFSRLYNYFSSIALNRFKWNNLPKGIESRYIEKALYEHGQCFFTFDEQMNFICLPCNNCYELNIYGEPIGVNVFGTGFSRQYLMDEGVRILENDLITPSSYHVVYYTELLTETEKTINMNLQQQKFPFVMPTTKENELSLKNTYSQYGNYEPILYTDKTLADMLTGKEGLKVMNTQAPYLLDKLSNFKKTCQNELYTFLGINNTDNSKKERLITDEVNANNGTILMSLDLAFKNRQKACELINEKYGLNITVEKTINNLELNFLGSEHEMGLNDFE